MIAEPSWGCLLCVARQSGSCHQSRDGSEAVWMAHVAWHFGHGSDIGPTYDQGILKGQGFHEVRIADIFMVDDCMSIQISWLNLERLTCFGMAHIVVLGAKTGCF